jgi:hypothetical protein
MKKLLLTLYFLSIAVFFGYSQSLSLSDSSGQVPNNSTITRSGVPTDAEIVVFLNVTNNSNKTISVKAKKVEISLLSPSYITFCWAGGCYPPTTFVSPNGTSMAAGATNTEFSGHYTPESVSGLATVRYVFFDEANPTDSVCVNVNYTAYPLGIVEPAEGTVTLSNPYPNPARNTVSFNYACAAGSDARLIICNVLGSTVKSESISAGTGKISVNTEDLNDGVYFYSILVNGKPNVTRKLIVRH